MHLRGEPPNRTRRDGAAAWQAASSAADSVSTTPWGIGGASASACRVDSRVDSRRHAHLERQLPAIGSAGVTFACGLPPENCHASAESAEDIVNDDNVTERGKSLCDGLRSSLFIRVTCP